MKNGILWVLFVMVACSVAMTSLAACGDDGEDDATAAGEACIVGVLPKTMAPYVNLIVTYYDAQGNEKSFTVRNGESSDDLPSYSKENIKMLELFSGLTIDTGKCILRTVKFSAPAGKKIACKYRYELTGKEVAEEPADHKVFPPFSLATGKRSNGEAILVSGSFTLSQEAVASLEAFKTYIERLATRTGENSIVIE